jgi:hypothetical protein
MKKTNALVVMLVAAMVLVAGGCQRSQKPETAGATPKPALAQEKAAVKEVKAEAKADVQTPVDNTKSDQDIAKKAAGWVAGLKTGDAEKDARVTAVIVTHIKAVRDWHNEHPYTTVPAGINPTTGNTLTKVDREVIADSTMPKGVHEELMTGLKKDLTPEQVEIILDKYTIGKVAFTMKGYQTVLPDMTEKEAAVIMGNLKEARERAVDFKTMEAISAIFKIYKTKCEQYLGANGRDWKKLYQQAYGKKQPAKPADSNSMPK